MFARRNSPQDVVVDLERIEDLVRARFDVDGDQIVLVTEEDGRDPGLPERMTTILFWAGPEARHRLRIFKPAALVTQDDLPPGWLRGALLDQGEAECC